MRRWTRSCFTLGLMALFAVAGCDDEDFGSTETPTLQVDPQAGFIFSKLAAGESAERAVDIVNIGSGTLILRSIGLEDESSSGGEFTLFQMIDGRQEGPQRIVEIAPNARATFLVAYAAADDSPFPDRGALVFESNDPSSIANIVPIVTGGAGGEIDVRPQTIDFGRVEAGQEAAQQLTVRNNGVSDLIVDGFSTNGSPDFSARLDGRELIGALNPPIVIGSGEQIVVDVIYAPPALGPDQGALIISSNDDNRPEISVTLTANGAAACIRVTPDSIEFGAALLVENRAVETPNRQGMTIASCGSSALRVDRIEFEGSEAFGLFEMPMVEEGEPLIALPAADEELLPSADLIVGFWPTELLAFGGTMLVYSNAPDSPTRVQLFGRGVDNACPTPAAAITEYAVQPLEIVTLDGSLSIDDGGEVREWRWEVVERPSGSVSEPVERFEDPRRPADGGEADDTTTPTAQFFVDLAGRYEIHLRVVDNLGQASCDPEVQRIVIEARPDKDLHIQMVWSTPADPDEADEYGTDLDLHLRHEDSAGAWGQNADGWDCYFANGSPEWGTADVVDNPTLDIDDTNGAGPENINLSRPEDDVVYDVGVQYFRASSVFNVQGNDPTIEHLSYATIRIYVRGDLIAEYVDQEMSTVSQMWWVASVRWCADLATCPEITPQNVVLSEEEWANP